MEKSRIFISTEIPMTDAISDMLAELKSVKNLRTVPAYQIHITFSFLGDTEVSKIPSLCSTLAHNLSEASGFEAVIKGMGVFPDIKRPKVIWIGFENQERLIELANIIRKTLDSLNLGFDRKPFSPHVTLARVNGKVDVNDILDRNKNTEFCRFQCSTVNIMKSELTPTGAKHSVIESIKLR